MLFKKLWRTMRLYRAQFISMTIMTALGIGIFVGFNMEWVSISENTQYLFDKTGYADYRLVSEAGFSSEEAESVAALHGVTAASRYLSVNVDVKEQQGDSVALCVTENEQVSGVYLMSGDAYDKNSTDGIWLSEKYADANGIAVGDALTFSYRGMEIAGVVRGLVKSGEQMICVRDESQLMPDYKTHGFAYISSAMYQKVMGVAYYPQVHVLSSLDKKTFSEEVDGALEKTVLILTKDESASYAGASGEMEEGKTMGAILPTLFLVIALLTMMTTMQRLTAKEKTQIGTLKALGFKDRRILRHYTSYAVMIGIVGSVIGVGLGYAVAWVIMNPNGMMGTYMDLPQWRLVFPWFCYLVVAGVLVLLTVIGYLSTKKMLSGTAADALRPYTPKKMKPMLMERTKWFHTLPFGTRWNLRDVIRHKSRTAMSLIGILGCSVLIVGSLGMGDTMDAFLDLYYSGVTNYSSRIFLSEDASAEQRESIAERYNGDVSASVSVELGEKAVSLDVYRVTHDRVRFPDENGSFVPLRDDGAYVCVRLADEFDLSVGDTVTVSPYGTDKEYTLKVAGIIRSVSESIVLNTTYAEALSIPHTVDSVYTDVAKEEIAADAAIKSIQSKQMIVESFDSFTEMMDLMIFILILGAMVLGIVVLYNLGVMSYTERYREMATLKVVGFRDRKIGRLLIGQNLWLSGFGVLLGIPAGIGTLAYLLKALAGEYEMKLALSCRTILISVVLTFGMSLLVSLMVSRKNKKIDMVEALKSAE